MIKFLIVVEVFLLVALISMVTLAFAEVTKCKKNETGPLVAVGRAEHYAFQHRDGSILYVIQDRQYYKCVVKIAAQRVVTKEEWEVTINQYRYEDK